ncbi:hypothetical protein [Streptomyces atratus]|uniref:Uncharacterized protein n=1 Tax=Streptomyces atratus TaxID=1893 RepID=A0A2Z5JP83_STRAR|nr:hypothetical protein [Streptomyces atratus]AXE82256.1 hypothetical protein C5746_41480 [Streptomyces atratus]
MLFGDRDETGSVFRLGWRGTHYPGTPVDDLWIAILKEPDGTWWFDAYFIGRVPLGGGAPRSAAFAQWLLATPPEGPYEKEFMLIDGERQSGLRQIADGTLLTVEVLMGREETGGPESLQVLLSGETRVQRLAFEVCAPLECTLVRRSDLEDSIARLLRISADEIPAAKA